MTFLSRPRVVIAREDIDKRVAELAEELRRDYEGKHPLLVGVLKGSFVFMSDLVRRMGIPLEIDFVRLSSYGPRRESSGKIRVVQGLKTPVKNRHVLMVEDIVDNGFTIRFFLDYLVRRKPASVRLCALLDKPSRRAVDVTIDYLGFTLPDAFVVGYGMDLDEDFRELPDVCVLED